MSLLGLPIVWGWLGLGLLLIVTEMALAPGSYLLWIGLAALGMAAIASVTTLSISAELTLFGVLALASGVLGWVVYGRRAVDDAAQELHDPARTLLGKVVIIATAIENGIGQAQIGDSVWRVSGPDMAAGSKARIVSVDGATLVVVPG
ncbi:MAG: NfeD family protein [Rhizobiales bacterium]|jgi:membrane protein implicated in regulation of membrane protease activity|nr:NfeD family protein [Hyphomicrobiales bacterium]